MENTISDTYDNLVIVIRIDGTFKWIQGRTKLRILIGVITFIIIFLPVLVVLFPPILECLTDFFYDPMK